jgi:peptidyl-prolyl cis-trans isomerase D
LQALSVANCSFVYLLFATRLDFFSAIVTMGVGEISQPIRTRLGFHIVQLTDFMPARQMNFEEVQPEIRLTIKNEKRRVALQALTADLLRRAKIVRPL